MLDDDSKVETVPLSCSH